MKLSHKQRIEKAHIAIMRHKDWVWLAPTCMIGNVILDKNIPTAGTDGRDVIYGTDFLDKLSEAQVRATVIHENEHKARRHLSIYSHLNERYGHKLVNMALDFAINRDIKKAERNDKAKGEAPFVECWDGLIEYCYDEKYDDDTKWGVIEILEDLKQNGGGGGGGKGGGDGGQDEHDWAGAKEMTAEEQEALGKEIEQALRQGQVLARKMAGNMPRDVGELLEPAVDWRQALRDFVTERTKGGDYATYARPNRRYVSYGVYMPSTYTETVETLLFACDTSGSIGPDDLREVLSEVQSCVEMVRPKAVDIIYWDTAVARHEHYEGDDTMNIMQSTKPAGGGGTAPSCVVGFCEQHNIKPSVVVWLSDGHVGGDWGEGIPAPAFWVISSNGRCPPHLPHVQLPKRI